MISRESHPFTLAAPHRRKRMTTALIRCLLALLLFRPAAGQRRARWRQLREVATSRSESHAAAVRAGAKHASRGCPCSDPALCQPLPAPAVARREVFGFVGGDGSQVDLSRVTTVAWAAPDNYALLCRAHASGTRVILSAPRPELVLTRNASARAEWVALTVAAVLSSHHDGVVFDWEAPCPVGSPLQAWYALLISETRDALHRVHDGYQVSTCVAWSPDDIDGRGYDIRTFALASDLLYVMDYDTRSQVVDACIAAANAPIGGTVRGVTRYLDIGVAPSQLVLGVPWYGYRYPCLRGTAADARFCPIAQVPFRGVNCSDAAGSEVGHDEIVRRLNSDNATTPRLWDANQGAPYFNTLEPATGAADGRAEGGGAEGRVVQYWYDDVESLAAKYAFARVAGLRGVGPYTFTDVASKADPMYRAFDAFLLPPSTEERATEAEAR